MTFLAAAAISAGASLIGSANSASAARSAANTQAKAAREASELSYKISQEQLVAQKEALDKQIAAAGATADKQLLIQRETLTQQLAQNESALAFQQRMYDQTRADFAPYRESGTANLNQLNTLLGIGGNTGAADYGRFKTADFTPTDFAAGIDPGYAFRVREGLKGIDRQAAARGGLISGNALKAASGFAGEQASQEYTNAFNRFQTIRGNTLQPFQMGAAAGQSAAAMQGQANLNFGSAGANAASANNAAYGQFGQGATGAYGTLGTGTYNAIGNYGQGVTGIQGAYGTNATNALTSGANATASGIVGSANAFNQGASGISNLANTYYINGLLRDKYNATPEAGATRTYNSMLSSGGFGTGAGFGNQDYGQYF
jgi:hypothetical protein